MQCAADYDVGGTSQIFETSPIGGPLECKNDEKLEYFVIALFYVKGLQFETKSSTKSRFKICYCDICLSKGYSTAKIQQEKSLKISFVKSAEP